MSSRKAFLLLALILLAILINGCAMGIWLSDSGMSLALRFTLTLIPLTVIAFVIGWLYPSRWWMAGFGAVLPLLFAVTALLTALPKNLWDVWARSPLILPFLVNLLSAFLGRLIHRSMLGERIHP